MKVLCVLYDDPKGGMPKNYPVSSSQIVKVSRRNDFANPTIDFNPGELLGCVSGELGLRHFRVKWT